MLKRQLLICGLCCLAVLVVMSACQKSAPAGNSEAGRGANATTPGAGEGQPDPAKLDLEIAHLEGEAEKDPDDDATRTSLAQAYYRRGSAFYQSGKLNEAMRDYQNALRFDPAHEEASLRLAQITREVEPEPRADDGKPVAVPATPGATKEP